MRRFIHIAAAVLMLCSCIGVNGRMAIRADGSGTLELSYKISRAFADLGRAGTGSGPLPLPVLEEDFRRGLADVKGVELRSFSRTENEEDVSIRAVIAFDSVDSLEAVRSFGDAPPSISTAGSRKILTQLVSKAAGKEISADSLEMLDAFFPGYSVTLIYEAPSAIQAHSLGTLSSDKKTLTFTSSVKDLVTAKKDVIVSLTW